MSQSYTASDIEVLSGLEPVRRRPGMYTHTSRPNHLAHEVIDNSVDDLVRKGSEEHTSGLHAPMYLLCRLLLEKQEVGRRASGEGGAARYAEPAFGGWK